MFISELSGNLQSGFDDNQEPKKRQQRTSVPFDGFRFFVTIDAMK